MKFVALGEVAKIDRTVASDGECKTLPYVGLEHIEKDTGSFATEFEGKPESFLATKFRFTSKHVLYGKLRPYLNKVVLPSFCGVCTTEILPILPIENKLDRTYLWAILLSPKFVDWASTNVAGANLPRLSPTLLAEYPIPLPPLDQQKRIAAILSKADRLRRLRRYARELSDGYLQSVFLEMFGDPVSNPRGWKIQPLEKVVKNQDARRIPIEESERAKRAGVYPYYGATGIIDYIDGYIFDETTLLIAEDGKNLLKRSKPITFMAYGKYWVNNHAHVVTENGQVDLNYLCASLNFRDISSFVTGIDQFKLNRANLDKIPVQIPPLPLQQKFAQVVQKYERLRAQQQESERQGEHLFQSLLHRAFQGEI